jgi:hypothetical protein
LHFAHADGGLVANESIKSHDNGNGNESSRAGSNSYSLLHRGVLPGKAAGTHIFHSLPTTPLDRPSFFSNFLLFSKRKHVIILLETKRYNSR